MLVPLPSLLQIPVTVDHYDPWPAGEWLQLNSPQHHSLLLFGGQDQVNCQVQIAAQSPCPETYAEASLCLIPAGVTYGIMSNRPFRVNLFSLPINLIRIMATNAGLEGKSELRLNLDMQDTALYHLALALALVMASEPHRPPNLLMRGSCSDSLMLTLAAYLVQHYGVGKSLEISIPQWLPAQSLDWQRLLEIQNLFQLCYPSPAVGSGIERVAPVLRSTSPSSGTVATAIAWLNQLCMDKADHPLTDMETRILTGVLQGENYSQIARSSDRSLGYIKTVASGLWKQLSEMTGQPLRKSNLRSYLAYQGLGLAMSLHQSS
ncbi:MAG: hypothetical protein ACKO21_11445 [Nodosilinea sp.]